MFNQIASFISIQYVQNIRYFNQNADPFNPGELAFKIVIFRLIPYRVNSVKMG